MSVFFRFLIVLLLSLQVNSNDSLGGPCGSNTSFPWKSFYTEENLTGPTHPLNSVINHCSSGKVTLNKDSEVLDHKGRVGHILKFKKLNSNVFAYVRFSGARNPQYEWVNLNQLGIPCHEGHLPKGDFKEHEIVCSFAVIGKMPQDQYLVRDHLTQKTRIISKNDLCAFPDKNEDEVTPLFYFTADRAWYPKPSMTEKSNPLVIINSENESKTESLSRLISIPNIGKKITIMTEGKKLVRGSLVSVTSPSSFLETRIGVSLSPDGDYREVVGKILRIDSISILDLVGAFHKGRIIWSKIQGILFSENRDLLITLFDEETTEYSSVPVGDVAFKSNKMRPAGISLNQEIQHSEFGSGKVIGWYLNGDIAIYFQSADLFIRETPSSDIPLNFL